MKAIPWGAVGFILGAVAGIAFGVKARENAGSAVTTDFSGGVATVRFDTKAFLRGGLPGVLANYF